jgi:hypothetical protein
MKYSNPDYLNCRISTRTNLIHILKKTTRHAILQINAKSKIPVFVVEAKNVLYKQNESQRDM